jgi:putative SOS response-associated peptidase YedK
MCNDYEQHINWGEYLKAMEQAHLSLAGKQGEHDLPQADDIRVNDSGPVLRAAGNHVELALMNFGFPPTGRGAPVFNFRSEGRRFGESKRCIIPASAFFEFTGTKYPKAKHLFTLEHSPFLGIAGLWREGQGNQMPAFTMLTTAPGEDVQPYHDRQVVVLPPEDWAAWLYLSRPEAEILKPLPKGSLTVETVRPASQP